MSHLDTTFGPGAYCVRHNPDRAARILVVGPRDYVFPVPSDEVESLSLPEQYKAVEACHAKSEIQIPLYNFGTSGQMVRWPAASALIRVCFKRSFDVTLHLSSSDTLGASPRRRPRLLIIDLIPVHVFLTSFSPRISWPWQHTHSGRRRLLDVMHCWWTPFRAALTAKTACGRHAALAKTRAPKPSRATLTWPTRLRKCF